METHASLITAPVKNLRKCVFLLTAAAAAAAIRHPAQLLLQHNGRPTLTMPVFSELLFIMSLKDVKRFLKDSMKSASPLFSYNLEGDGEVHSQKSWWAIMCFFLFAWLVSSSNGSAHAWNDTCFISPTAPPLHHPVKSLKGRWQREGGRPAWLINANVIGSERPRLHLAANYISI